MKKIKLEGAITAIVTPFKKDGALDIDALKRLLKYQLSGGINGIVVCGSTGEAATLNDEEYARAVKCAVEEIGGKIPVIAGAGSNNTQRAIELSRIAQEQGVDGLLHVTPYYNKPTPNGLVAHFKAIAEAVPLPIIIYNVPGRTGSNVPPVMILRIAKEVPAVVAVKEASGSINQIGAIIENAPKGFVVLSGDDALTLPAMILGAKGCISVVANESPKLFSALCQEALKGEWHTARVLHFKLLRLMDVNFVESNPIPVKAALSMMGFIEDVLRLPLVALENKNRPEVERCLKELGLIKRKNGKN
ncbi:4-hydroxy-tetrahydrodipicolinate synthase [Candidatus Kaiserbacteria bacterium RIFCSPHIGHO2_12_FULL_53_13]|uniref:4-hydroxy-tetrahydrodipicolinate synthase n=1 Tax=Candidatus Kaiserbacteria bacterium RIFCSPHIGHO2_12_FULL_53_13 TaxID=1798502 RepID=A0A1F6EBA7_9BACT|nr:MAG: 4-hydroxy-tetrahydrodipicolinate synthase [Candidatus Kaiserbacteria bacterium RIFCSPHIGHO2_12_FULL_53_13]OGG74358.1 MAG: 4-hydroxy-tetrahydrodipicolinate synthase [Candidatus Kaiserbacteria bacterium RIFCSPLOWO2_01_FULL_52_36]